MAVRNSPAYRVPGNPLAGLLQQTARKARSTSRKSSVPGPQGEPGPEGPPGPVAPPVGPVVVVATLVTSDATGVAVLEFEPLQSLPVVVATAVGVAAVATVSHVTETSATLQVWLPDGVTPAPSQTLHVIVATAN